MRAGAPMDRGVSVPNAADGACRARVVTLFRVWPLAVYHLRRLSSREAIFKPPTREFAEDDKRTASLCASPVKLCIRPDLSAAENGRTGRLG